MDEIKAEDIASLTRLVETTARGMSADEVAALVAHPSLTVAALHEASLTVTRLLGTPERLGGEPHERLDPATARRRLARRTRSAEGLIDDEMLSSTEMARRLGLKVRQSVNLRNERQELIGFELGRRGLQFPAAQLDEDGRPLPGISQVRKLFPDGYSAWRWLTASQSALDDDTPLERLQCGNLDAVLDAARSLAQGDFT